MLMTVDVRSNPRQALAIPEIAILDQADGAYVYRVTAREGGGQQADLARIQTGQRSGGMAEVLDGLAVGDRVVTEGVQSMRPGLPVQVAGDAPAEAGAPELRPRG
jgi:membrane fusion protein (multidrug efflux system)